MAVDEPLDLKFDLRFFIETGDKDPKEIIQHVVQLLDGYCNYSVVKTQTIRHHKLLHQAPYEDEIYEINLSALQKEIDKETMANARKQRENSINPNVQSLVNHWAQELQLNWCRGSAGGLHEQIRMNIVQPSDAYYQVCRPDHKSALNGIALGNLINMGVFLEVYSLERKGELINGFVEQRSYEDSYEPITAEFHHDRKVLQIQVDSVDNEAFVRDELRVDYKSIWQCVVDVGQTDGRDMYMYLGLKYPPTIKRGQYRPDNRNNRGRPGQRRPDNNRNSVEPSFNNWRRQLSFERCHPDILGKASTLKLCFDPCLVQSRTDSQPRATMSTLWQILGRLKYRAKIDIWFGSVKTAPRERFTLDLKSYCTSISDQYFSCCYALSALFSRGYRVEDQLTDHFLRRVLFCAGQNSAACEHALNYLVNGFDEHKNISLLTGFERLYRACILDDNEDGFRLEDTDVPDPSMTKVRKLVVTPTRHLFLAPEVMMHNRITRRFNPDYALRVSFRDDPMNKFYPKGADDSIFEKMVRGSLVDGIYIGNRHYQFLGWSNSQLRDHSCYMYARNDAGESVEAIRKWMGDFSKIKNVPKLMARMGQCYTQSLATDIKKESGLIEKQPDIMGGAKDPGSQAGERFCFSDGVGRISRTIADEITKHLQTKNVREGEIRRHAPRITPSAFQIRYAGYKGMLTVDPRLDTQRAQQQQQPKIVFRDSMYKFAANEDGAVLEIVKWSQPTRATLNRPLIMILDQMTFKEGPQNSSRLRRRIHELLENQLFEMADILLSEHHSALALMNRTPLNIRFDELKDVQFRFTSEPFFRGLLLAIHAHSIQSLFKCKIEIPFEQGRVMYGVMDETGVLSYGQVFIQYSVDPKEPSKEKKIHHGNVMVTKNPCIVPGDVRMLKAVHAKPLTHLVDVIVFPRVGPRPHSDEMAGSDLDGDEYAVFWDEKLFMKGNSKAMTFQKLKADDVDRELTNDDMVQFFRKYVNSDTIGTIATAHIVAADRRGLEHPICNAIAAKHSLAVDFPKTGHPPEPLEPDEKVTIYPDFLGKTYQATYRSKWLLGQLYRKIKKVEDIIQVGQCSMETCTPDKHLLSDGWSEPDVIAEAVKLRDQYNGQLQSLIDQYGIPDEAQLVSGHMLIIRNRLSDGEKEDFSFFNTERILEMRIGKIWDKFRTKFFEEYGSLEDFADPENFYPTDSMKAKATAWYQVTYDEKYGNRLRFLSFPWIVWDVLKWIKREQVYGNEEVFGTEAHMLLGPVVEKLHGEIQNRAVSEDSNQYKDVIPVVKDALKEYNVLRNAVLVCPLYEAVFRVLVKWLKQEGAFDGHHEVPLRPAHICLLYLLYVSEKSEKRRDLAHPVEPPALLSDFLLTFVKYMGSEQFRHSDNLSINGFTLHRSQSITLHFIAFKTYQHVALTGRFEALYITERPSTQSWDFDETDPIELSYILPWDIKFKDASRLLAEWSGCEQVDVRNVKWQGRTMCVISGSGKLEARQMLRAIALVEEKILVGALYAKKSPIKDIESVI